ncbi:MAG TPA: hypothetical protein VHN77_02165 [Phycisphaerales bacterium]|nr:hypothetical protein [Phycisphaerales bacterium]
MSSFKGLNLFGSGPHRFRFARQGHLVTLDLFNGGSGPGSTSHGTRELDIIASGRLVATSEAALWTLRNAIRAQLTASPAAGTLIDSAGRSWTGMTLITYTESDRRDQNRVFSITYEAHFRQF